MFDSKQEIRDIAVGVLVDSDDRLLIARRPAGTPGAGFWEFPGGKREPGEVIRDCLARELAEEIGVHDIKGRPLIRFAHDRGPRPVRLHVWRIHEWTGTPAGCEGQPLRWLPPDALDASELLPATDVILNALTLPQRYLITPSLDDTPAWHAALDRALADGVRLLRVRDHALDDALYARRAKAVVARAHAADACVLLDRNAEMVMRLGADGLHWPAARLIETGERALQRGFWLAVSAHDARDLEAAAAAGADFATLSPIKATASHPGAAGLGWTRWHEIRGDIEMPVYALGGLSIGDEDPARQHNAQGIAAIRGLWPAVG